MTVLPDGNVEFIYDDLVPIESLGIAEIERASDIIFDIEQQKWKIEFRDHIGLSCGELFEKRGDAVRTEVRTLAKKMIQ